MTGLVQVTIGREGGRVEETANGVTTLQGRTQSQSASLRAHATSSTDAVLASRVELTTEIVGLDVEQRLVDETGDHPVLVGFQELSTGNGTLLHDTRAVTLLCAPCDLLTLGVGDRRVSVWGTPQAEV